MLRSCASNLEFFYRPYRQRTLLSQVLFCSPEFAIKGRYTVGFYRAAFNRSFNIPEFAEFIADMQFVTGASDAETNAKRTAFATDFVQRAEFVNIYGGMSDSTYVNTLMGRYNLTTISTPD